MANSRDVIYTPQVVAAQLAAGMPHGLQGKVLDPTAGEGALLDAVIDRFGADVQPLAIDISPVAVSALASRGWVASRADALVPRSRGASRAWRAATDDLAAVVLNPPFSYRGSGGRLLRMGSFEGRVAPAVDFLASALINLNPKHGVWAILPEGATRAQKHAGFWAEVKKEFVVDEIAVFGDKTFPGAHVTTSLVHVYRRVTLQRTDAAGEVTPIAPRENCACVEVIRGRVPVHSLGDAPPPASVPYLHTTDFGPRRPSIRRRANQDLADHTPLILFPRVGRWSGPHLIEIGRVVLSDCLIGLRPTRPENLDALVCDLRSHAGRFRAAYRGTGAKYLTLASITILLESLGWSPVVSRASSPRLRCACVSGQEDTSLRKSVGE